MQKGNGNSVNPLMLLRKRPNASAVLRGSSQYPAINGSIWFYQTQIGVFVLVQASGLPQDSDPCIAPIFGFHIHEGDSCTGNSEDEFADTLSHYNPDDCPHPYHAGDMPPLFGVHGNAFLAFLTDRFSVSDVIGKTVVIHSEPDDFSSQPSGNSGMKIACGKISK